MKTIIFTVTLLALQLLPQGLRAAEDNVATVLVKRGEITAKLPNGKEVSLAINQKLPVGSIVQTQDKSFVKLIFADNSTMNLGPMSQMVIQSYPKKEAGIIKLVKGQIRAEVTKTYMQIDDKSKSKLFIQTKSASMGIRGTDFQVNYNPENENSTLIVFEGKVAMAHIDRELREANLDQKKLEDIVSGTTAVMVREGQFSAVNQSVADRALIPTKLAPSQLDALKANPSGLEEATGGKSKKVRDVVPPGLDAAGFINKPAEVIEAEKREAQGFANEKTGQYKPKAGALIDLKTAAIMEPPKGAKFDPASKTFLLDEALGRVNKKTGAIEVANGLSVRDLAPVVALAKRADVSESKNDKASGGSNETPTLVRANPSVVKDNPSVTKENPSVVKDNPSVVKDKPAIAKEIPAVVKEAPAVVKENPAAAKKEVPSLAPARPNEAVTNADQSKKLIDAENAARAQKEEADRKAKEAEESALRLKAEADSKAKAAEETARKLKEEADMKQKAIDEELRLAQMKDDADRKQKEQMALAEQAKKDAEELALRQKKEAEAAAARQKAEADLLKAKQAEEAKAKPVRDNSTQANIPRGADTTKKAK